MLLDALSAFQKRQIAHQRENVVELPVRTILADEYFKHFPWELVGGQFQVGIFQKNAMARYSGAAWRNLVE